MSSPALTGDWPLSHRGTDSSYRQGSGYKLTLALIRRTERHLANQKLAFPAWGTLRKKSPNGSVSSGIPLLDPSSFSSHREEGNWSLLRMASSSVLNIVARRREIPRMSQFGSVDCGVKRGWTPAVTRLGFKSWLHDPLVV